MFKCYSKLQLKEEIPMAVSDIEAVVEFLRSNGFSDSEAALMEDVMEKSQLGSSDFQKFLFPMVPPLPPVKIPAAFRRSEPELPGEDAVSGLISPSDEGEDFVSFASSTTELCSSDFTNPYAVHNTTRPSSQASSDRMSQFGTARDYHEFDMQNDIYWLKEKDEDYVMPPPFGISDMNGDPTEDKFVMTVETQKNKDFSLDSHYYDDGQWSVEKRENQGFIDHYHFEGVLKAADQDFIHHTCAELCACSSEEAYTESDPHQDKSRNDGIVEFESPDLFQNQLTEEDIHGNENRSNRLRDNLVPSETSSPDEVADDEVAAPDDELLAYQTREDEYEVFTLRIIHRKNRTGFEEIKDFPIVLNTIVAGRYYITEYLGSAAFSKVAQARDLHTGMDVCLKIIKNDKDFFDQSLDEIKLLKYVNKHDPGDDHHILRLYDYFYFREHLFIVCELLRANLYEFQKFNKESGGEPYFTLSRLQVITRQCLEALEYLHGLGIMHCDLKPENILIKSYRRCEIKIIDLGSSCFQTDHLSLYVQSRSYRAPEVILGDSYDQKIDLWSLGCILAELYSGEVLFPNEAIALLLARVIAILGPFDVEMLERGQEAHKYFTNEYDLYYINEETNELEYIIAEDSSPLKQHLQISDSLYLDFLSSLLETNPQRRPTAREALDHPWLSHPYQELDPSS